MAVWQCWHSPAWFITTWCLDSKATCERIVNSAFQLLVFRLANHKDHKIHGPVTLEWLPMVVTAVKWLLLLHAILPRGQVSPLSFGRSVGASQVVKGPLFPLFPEGWEGPQGRERHAVIVNSQTHARFRGYIDSWEVTESITKPLVQPFERPCDTDIFSLTSAIPAKTCSSSARRCLVLIGNLKANTTLLNGREH